LCGAGSDGIYYRENKAFSVQEIRQLVGLYFFMDSNHHPELKLNSNHRWKINYMAMTLWIDRWGLMQRGKIDILRLSLYARI